MRILQNFLIWLSSCDQLIADHANLVKRIAFHLLNRLPPSVQAEDLIQAGMIGLLEAARDLASRLVTSEPELVKRHLARWLGGRQDYLRV